MSSHNSSPVISSSPKQTSEKETQLFPIKEPLASHHYDQQPTKELKTDISLSLKSPHEPKLYEEIILEATSTERDSSEVKNIETQQ